MITSRRAFVTGLISLVAAPAIIRVESLMPIKQMAPAILLPPYGLSPAMMALPDMIDLDKCVKELLRITGIPKEYIRGN